MLFSQTNIEQELSSAKNVIKNQPDLLKEVEAILKKEEAKENQIKKRLTKAQSAITNQFDFDLLETDKIYHIETIKNICIDYRLRFLDSKYFKGQIPNEGIAKVKNLEKEHDIELSGFKIMAPSKLFKLEDKDDPLLFAPIGNGYYYLIHKWGNDLHPLRKALVWPFKNVINLGLVTIFISYLATLLVPEGLFSTTSSAAEFWIIFFFMFKSIAAIVIFYGFALGKNFNPAIWNSKYFNA